MNPQSLADKYTKLAETPETYGPLMVTVKSVAEELRQAAAEVRGGGPSIDDWVSVDDRMPIDGRVVVAGQQMEDMYSEPWLMQWNDGHWYWFPENTKSSSYPSHWRPLGLIPPLPSPPGAVGVNSWSA